MTTTNRTDLTTAIRRSRSHNEIVSVDYVGTIQQLRADLAALCPRHDIDDVEVDGGWVDVWGCESGSEEMDWRLAVTLTD